MFKAHQKYNNLLAGLIVLGLAILLICKLFRLSINAQWCVMLIWFFLVICIVVWVIFREDEEPDNQISKFERYKFVFIIIISCFCYFFLLESYPFLAIGDEVRDGGLQAVRLMSNKYSNIFDYGSYNSHGLIIPFISGFFSNFLPESVLAYRIPAAILAISSVIILYLIIKKYVNSHVAFWSSLILIALPMHLYYARTEIVVISSSFLTVLILLALFRFRKDTRLLSSIVLLALVLGFSMNFYASVKPVVYLSIFTFLIFLTKTLYEDIKNTTSRMSTFIDYISRISIFIVVFCISFGPRILFTPVKYYFSSDTSTGASLSLVDSIVLALRNYPKAFMVYFYESTTTHFMHHSSVMSFLLGIFFILGLFFLLINKNKYLNIVGFFAIVLPFTNSAFTNIVNADHRLTVLLPISAILAGYGIYNSIEYLKENSNIFFNVIFQISALFIVLTPLLFFFTKEYASVGMMSYADKDLLYRDFALTHTLKNIKDRNLFSNTNTICITAMDDDLSYLDLLHIREQFLYFLPDHNLLTQKAVTNYSRPVFIVSRTCKDSVAALDMQKYIKLQPCETSKRFVCPTPKLNKPFDIYLEK